MQAENMMHQGNTIHSMHAMETLTKPALLIRNVNTQNKTFHEALLSKRENQPTITNERKYVAPFTNSTQNYVLHRKIVAKN